MTLVIAKLKLKEVLGASLDLKVPFRVIVDWRLELLIFVHQYTLLLINKNQTEGLYNPSY